MEFKPFPKIERFKGIEMTITQKIHGSNAQIYIYQDETTNNIELLCGSRSRWITPEDDNYGFARFVHDNKEQFINKLGVGQHFGEWAGPGINSGEGLTEKIFVLFDWRKFPEARPLPPRTKVVPVLYHGKDDLQEIQNAMNILRNTGSRLVDGFMRPEGIVIEIDRKRYKKVFDAEETRWKDADKSYQLLKQAGTIPDYSHFLQPLRLEKLLSRDERYIKEYPGSLTKIVTDYIADLSSETTETFDEKSLNKQVYPFVRILINGLEK